MVAVQRGDCCERRKFARASSLCSELCRVPTTLSANEPATRTAAALARNGLPLDVGAWIKFLKNLFGVGSCGKQYGDTGFNIFDPVVTESMYRATSQTF